MFLFQYLTYGMRLSWQGKVPLLSEEALHQLHIFIFVLAVSHVFFCASTMLLGGAKVIKMLMTHKPAELHAVNKLWKSCCFCRLLLTVLFYSDTQMEKVGGGNSEKRCSKRYQDPACCSYFSAMQWHTLVYDLIIFLRSHKKEKQLFVFFARYRFVDRIDKILYMKLQDPRRCYLCIKFHLSENVTRVLAQILRRCVGW